jgi:hypothetical protein
MTTQKQGFADAAMLTTGLEQLDEAPGHTSATPREVIAAPPVLDGDRRDVPRILENRA